MGKLDDLFSEVRSSATAAEEESRVNAVWQYMYENRINVAVNVVAPSGEKSDIQALPDSATIKNVEVVFTVDREAKSYPWTPIDSENVFLLFREK